ncbi:dephospho-CoA kinase [Mesobacillus maritimus]|uniref:dephospho-CoA kinase n=1 Tax=Mesobacillus maritimus TaxID=1643336 RepID=UPI00203CD607|nr:dephospho-CoA kinase [Mesobacillus maritimus]MCM3588625.1 dephospho-CoA kinase [Mesobacillus maritimus]MCM3670016.1 dephospho-CoA kinase [Mesobacillus maritimus]
MSLTIGLTGGIASGKSTVSKMFQAIGIQVIDADIEARLAVEKGERAYNDIVNYFGEEILQQDGSINREKLGSIVFHDELKRKALNSFVHPAVRERMLAKVEEAKDNGSQAIVLDIPLLIEGKLQYMADKILLVYVDEETQLKRLMDRNQFSKEDALARINSQMPLKEKIEFADAVIDNNATIENTEQQLKEILTQWGLKEI